MFEIVDWRAPTHASRAESHRRFPKVATRRQSGHFGSGWEAEPGQHPEADVPPRTRAGHFSLIVNSPQVDTPCASGN